MWMFLQTDGTTIAEFFSGIQQVINKSDRILSASFLWLQLNITAMHSCNNRKIRQTCYSAVLFTFKETGSVSKQSVQIRTGTGYNVSITDNTLCTNITLNTSLK